MILFHPGAAQIDCVDCCKRLYDLRTGKPQTYKSGPARVEKFYDGPDHKPPCQTGETCPKGSPTQARDFVLTPRSRAVLFLYLRNRATMGRAITPEQTADPTLGEFLAIVDGMVRKLEREETGIINARELVKGL